MFQIKNFTSIVGAIINHMRGTQSRITDFNVGGVARTLIESPAVEIDELYQQMWSGLKEAIPVATFNSFSFSALPSVPAAGLITVTITVQATNTLIPGGTAFTSSLVSTVYVSETDVIIAAGNTVASVLVAATTAGAATNIGAALSFAMTPVPAGFVSAINPGAFTSGADLETPDQRLQRFQEYISTLARGTIASIIRGAKTTILYDSNGLIIERVVAAALIEPYVADHTQPIGLINLYIHNGVGSTSGSLVTRAAQIVYGYTDSSGTKIPGWQAAGVTVVTAAASEVAVTMTGVLTPAPGYAAADLIPIASAVLADYALALDLGQPFLFGKAVALVIDIAGVGNFVFSAPLADVTATKSQKIMPGTITVTPA